MSNFKPQSQSDGIFEVIGLTSIWHLGQVQVGLDQPLKICQGSSINLKFIKDGEQALQIDGEPFLIYTPAQINI